MRRTLDNLHGLTSTPKRPLCPGSPPASGGGIAAFIVGELSTKPTKNCNSEPATTNETKGTLQHRSAATVPTSTPHRPECRSCGCLCKGPGNKNTNSQIDRQPTENHGQRQKRGNLSRPGTTKVLPNITKGIDILASLAW